MILISINGKNGMDTRSLDEKLQAIEARLARIEYQFRFPPMTPPPAATSTPTEAKTISEEEKPLMVKSGNWLGIISVICFVLAAGFIVKLSIESGWLTPARQIGIAALFGFGLIGVGIKLLNLDKEYTSLLPATGIIVLYLTTFAAYRLYSLIPFENAIVISGAISLLCIGLYLKIKHDIYPITAAVGAYLAPAVLGLNVNSTFTLYYFVICSLTFATLSIWVKSRLLTMISAYLAILVTAAIGIDLNQHKLIAIIIALQFFIFSVGTFLYTQYVKKSLTENESWSFFPVLLIFYGAEYYFIYLIQPNLAAWISLAFAAFLICLYLIAKQLGGRPMASQSMILTFAAIVFFHSGYLELLPLFAKPWLFVVIILGLAFLPAPYASKNNNPIFYFPIFLLLLSILGIEYARMALNLFLFNQISWSVVSLSIISIWLLYIYQNTIFRQDDSYGYALLGAAHLIVILAFYRLADPHGSLAVSASWLIYAIAIISFAFIRKDKIMANSALLVLFFAAGKALLYDASSAPTIIRILCLLVTGIVLYGSGFLFRKIAKWGS